MADDKKIYDAQVEAPSLKTTEHVHPPVEWLKDWPSVILPTRNGTNQNNYLPKIKKYIIDWLDLVGDVHRSGKKFILRNLRLELVSGSTDKFKVVAEASSDDNIPPSSTNPNTNKTKSTGGGLPGEQPAGEHLIPPPPPPPPNENSL